MYGFIEVERMIRRLYNKWKNYSRYRDFNLWVFGEWFGTRCDDNCFVLANYIAENVPSITTCWIADENCQGTCLLNKNIMIMKKDSYEAISILKKAGVVFVNEGLQDLTEEGINYTSGAIILNLWHGVPWKKIGMDSYSKKQVFTRLYAKVIYKLQEFDYFLSPSDLCTDALCSGFMINHKNIITVGLPRNSLFYEREQCQVAKRKLLNEMRSKGIKTDPNTRVICYLPTFRDNVRNSFSFGNIKDSQRLEKTLRDYNAIVVQKSHIANQRREDSFGASLLDRIITENDRPAQELMAASDILVTDYSSCFFDYLILDRPIIHYLYDYDYYSGSDRGLYYNKEDVVCGDAVADEESLVESIINNLNNPDKDAELRKLRREQYMTHENRDSCKIITEYILGRIEEKKAK